MGCQKPPRNGPHQAKPGSRQRGNPNGGLPVSFWAHRFGKRTAAFLRRPSSGVWDHAGTPGRWGPTTPQFVIVALWADEARQLVARDGIFNHFISSSVLCLSLKQPRALEFVHEHPLGANRLEASPISVGSRSNSAQQAISSGVARTVTSALINVVSGKPGVAIRARV